MADDKYPRIIKLRITLPMHMMQSGGEVKEVSRSHREQSLNSVPHLLLLSVQISTALKQMVDQFIHHPTNHPGQDVADVVATFQFGWRPFAHC
ncbi:hypothetical protein [Ktedonobacter racemifer]|uniref:CurL C-terminal domain-containing protein n=1 Tax=Ktedonobacter racemifer TaxID=363277 RepID=UPI0002EECD55